MAKQLKIGITFNEVDSDVYDFLKSKEVNASQLVRKLVERYMITKNINTSVRDVISEAGEEVSVDETTTEEIKKTETDEKQTDINKNNLNKLKGLADAYSR